MSNTVTESLLHNINEDLKMQNHEQLTVRIRYRCRISATETKTKDKTILSVSNPTIQSIDWFKCSTSLVV